MKKVTKTGFTLIELLAVIIILGVLLLIAVPSVSKYITNSRINTYETNLLKLVDAVSNEVNSYKGQYSFSSNQYLIVPFKCIEIEKGSNTKSPFGSYIDKNSFVVVTRKYETGTNTPIGFNYYVSTLDVNGFGASLSDPYSTNFKVISNPKITQIEEVIPSTNPKTYTLTGEGTLSSEFSIESINKKGKLVTCEALGTNPGFDSNSNLLYDKILSDNVAYADNVRSPYVNSDTGIKFGQISSDTNGKGLYYTSTNTENNGTTYYFRGDVKNNYVKFGKETIYSCTYNGKTVSAFSWEYDHLKTEEFCLKTPVCMLDSKPYVGSTESECTGNYGTWTNEMATLSTAVEDIYWRIVRINEDGSIRMFKQDSAGMAKYTVYNDPQNDNAYVGYMYGSTGQTGDNAYNLTHSNDNSSVIKTYIDDWYTNYTNLSNYKGSHLADAGFCNDRSVAPSAGLWSSFDTALGYGQNITVYGAAGRLVEFKSSTSLTAKANPQPQFKCPNEGRDLFTLSTSSKGNKALTNPVGLLTADEVAYAGGVYGKNNNSMYLSNTGWIMSPIYFNGMGFVSSGNTINYDYLSDTVIAHPVINLSSTVVLSDEIPSGCTKLDGTQACPYIIKVN